MATFMLVTGALHGAWVWNRVKSLLEQADYRVLAPDLPGIGEDRSISASQATLALWAEFLVAKAREADAPRSWSATAAAATC